MHLDTCCVFITNPKLPSVLWRCWLGDRKGIRPVKNIYGYWDGYLSGARCRLAYGPADATDTHCLLLQQNPDWFYLSGSPGKRAVKRVCVCVHAHARTKQQHVTFNLPTTLEYDLSFIVFQKHRLLSPLIRLLSFFSLWSCCLQNKWRPQIILKLDIGE